MPTAARILWRSAGCPIRDGIVHPSTYCWWCGMDGLPTGDTSDLVPETFPDRVLAKAGLSKRICAACAWTLNERTRIPAAYAARRMTTLCEAGRRMQGVLRGQSGRWLALLLEDGRIGLWTPGPTANSEEPWKKATPDLRSSPADVGPCRFLEAVSPSELEPDASEKFRNYHHFGGENLPWEVASPSDKARIREILFHPPEGEYTAVIGDGQKHGVLRAEQGYGPIHAAVYFQPSSTTIFYHPDRLIRLVDAVELVVAAGCDDDELVSGKYIRASMQLTIARKQAEPMLSEHRGSAFFDLAVFLRRPRPELKEDSALATRLCPPFSPPGSEAAPLVKPVECAGNEPRPSAVPDPAPVVAEPVSARGSRNDVDDRDRSVRPLEPSGPRQLSLFGG